MTNTTQKAFAVQFADLNRWNVNSFFTIQWHWPEAVIQPMSCALERKVLPCADSATTVVMVTLHFDGEVVPREMGSKKSIKGRLIEAKAGDVIYSRIDVRNGAIGLIPPSMPVAAVTNEFPVYTVRRGVADPEYIKLVFRTRIFRQQINSMISGASGRKRVQPFDLERVRVPLPSLEIQQAILTEWRKARREIAEAEERIRRIESEIEEGFFAELGLKNSSKGKGSKCYAVSWSVLDRWSVEYMTRRALRLIDADGGKYPTNTLKVLCRGVSGCTPSTKNPKYWGGGILWVSPKDMKSTVIHDTQDHITQAAVQEFGSPVIPARAVLLVMRSGILQRLVPTALLRRSASINQDMRAFIVKDELTLLPEFLVVYLHHSQRELLELVKWSTTVQSLNKSELDEFLIPVPPLAVQRRIVADVEAGRTRIAHEREKAHTIAGQIEADLEAYLLGTKKVGAN